MAASSVLSAALFAIPLVGDAQATSPAMQFGMDANSVSYQKNAGVAPDYGSFWVGPWTLKSGWGGPDSQMDALKAAGVTPAFHLYYWGDDISQSCLTNGCYSTLHSAQKDQAGWETLIQQSITHLNTKMAGKPVVIFLESEFNKADVQTWEPLDAMLADKARELKAGYPAAQVVLSLGSWNQPAWGTWDRAAAAMDLVGIQGMRGSTKDSLTHYQDLYESTLAGAQKLQSLFHKPVILQDLALSSYPEPDYLARQQAELSQFFDNMPALKAAGVQAMMYRTWRDNPNMNTANYYGEAERHWGLTAATYNKPSMQVWIDGVKAERASAQAPVDHAPVAAFTAAMDGLTVNVDGSGSSDADGDAMAMAWSFGDGATAAGATASHAFAAAGTYTVRLTVTANGASATKAMDVVAVQPNRAPVAAFATMANGLTASLDASSSSDPDGDALSFAWSFGDGTSGMGKTASHAFPATGTYTVTLTASDGKLQSTSSQQVAVKVVFAATFASKGNEWWVETAVSGNSPISKVEVKAGSADFVALPLTSWGSYAKSLHVVQGTQVTFRATDATGQVVTSAPAPWLGPAPAPTPVFKATFTPKNTSNNYYVEAKVASQNGTIAKVEASVNGGAWTKMPATNWGTFAVSMKVSDYAKVQFRATSTSGATALSEKVTWI